MAHPRKKGGAVVSTHTVWLPLCETLPVRSRAMAAKQTCPVASPTDSLTVTVLPAAGIAIVETGTGPPSTPDPDDWKTTSVRLPRPPSSSAGASVSVKTNRFSSESVQSFVSRSRSQVTPVSPAKSGGSVSSTVPTVKCTVAGKLGDAVLSPRSDGQTIVYAPGVSGRGRREREQPSVPSHFTACAGSPAANASSPPPGGVSTTSSLPYSAVGS